MRLSPDGRFVSARVDEPARSLPYLGIVLSQHEVEGRLAEQVFVLRVLFQKSELRGHRARRLAHGLLPRPLPCEIEVRLAEYLHGRGGRAVRAVEEHLEQCPPGREAPPPFQGALLEVHHPRELLESRVYLGDAERALRQDIPELIERFGVDPEAESLVVPGAEARGLDDALDRTRLRDGHAPRGHRPHVLFDGPVPCVEFGEYIVGLAGKARGRKRDLSVLAVAGSRGAAVHEDKPLEAGIGLECDPPPGRGGRKDYAGAEPTVFPLRAPGRSNRHGREGQLRRLLDRKPLLRDAALELHFAELLVEVPGQLVDPIADPIAPFPGQRHRFSLLCSLGPPRARERERARPSSHLPASSSARAPAPLSARPL